MNENITMTDDVQDLVVFLVKTVLNFRVGNPHVAAGSLPTHQQAAYLSATGQLPYGYTYAYQPGVLPQGGVYPTFTAPSVYQVIYH